MSSKIIKGHPEVCEHYCTNVIHGNLITAALTKNDVSDEALIYYMLGICEHFSTARDNVGRSALHMAASCGRSSMVTWLVTYRNAKLEDRDRESGYTALHRSLFYGKINTAVALVKLGSNMHAMDEEGLTPLEHVMKDALSKFPRTKFAMSRTRSQDACDENHLGELYSWGSNSNYTLLDRHERRYAELSHFHKHHPHVDINTIHLEKYHCMVSRGSRVYAWGHGLGGRLGLNTNNTVLVPGAVRIELKPNRYSTKHFSTQHLDVARDHSIFLDVRGYVRVCGLNEHSVLGVASNVAEALQPVCVSSLKDKNIIGVACGKYHSVAYSKTELYTWGLNGGQLGHTADCGQYIALPKKVNRLFDVEPVDFDDDRLDNDTIIQVSCSDAATGILTSHNTIYILNEFQRRRILVRSTTARLRQLHVYGGKLEARAPMDKLAQAQQELHVAVVTWDSNLMLWRASDQQLRRCLFTLGRPLAVANVVLNARGCVFTTSDHEVFLGSFKVRKGNTTASKVDKKIEKKRELGMSSFHAFLEKSECVVVKVTKVPRIHRACHVTSDPDGDNFIVLQNNRCKEFFYDESMLDENSDIQEYFHSLCDEYCDENSLHDFKFIVENRNFFCHKYILAHASTELANLVRKSSDNVHVVESIPADIFEQMLQFIYTGNCEVADVDKLRKRDTDSKDKLENKKEQEKCRAEDFKDLSAFVVYNQNSNKSNAKQRLECDKSITQLKLLLACAKQFGLHMLQKRIDHFLNHTRIRTHVCVGCCEKAAPMIFYQRKKFVDFSDIDVVCANGDKIKAHKCMLMRLEYFRNMFARRWNRDRSSVTIDYPPLHVQHFLDFIYVDSVPDIPDMENILILLVLADEFIVPNLRAMCEYRLCKHINIKTVAHLYLCSISYGACILKNICSQFIVAHLAELLELRTLESIDDENLIDISKLYLKQKSNVFNKRLITPFSYVPNIEKPPSDFRLEVIETANYQAIETPKVLRKRTRRHKTSSASEHVSDINDSVEILESESNKVNNSTNTQTLAKPSSRFEAIKSATEKLNESVEIDGEFTNLSLLSSSLDESEFPDLSAVNLSGSSLYSKSPGKSTDWKSLPKMSQKARKRLQSESNNCSAGTAVQNTTTNPWKVVENAANISCTLPAVQKDMTDILKSERVQKGNLIKMRNKLLSSTQIEDRAIFELEKFYNIDNIEDEIIEVRRIESCNVALPTWVAKN